MTTLDTVLLFRKSQPKTSLEIFKTIIRKLAYNDILDYSEKQIFLQILKSEKQQPK
jgi:hypothetical protein